MSTISAAPSAPPRLRKTLLSYVPAESPFYAFHPAARLVLFLFVGIVPIFIDMPEVNFGLILCTLLLLAWGRVRLHQLKQYFPVIVTVAVFMFTVVLLAPGNKPEHHALHIGSFTVYYEPTFFTFASYVRLIAMLFGTILYFSTNRERELLVALRWFRLPFIASYVIGLSVRSASMFMEDFRTIREAEQARGLDASGMKLADQAKLYAMYLVPLFSIALRRADEIGAALFARGFSYSGAFGGAGRRPDYVLQQYPMRSRDWIAIAVLGALFLAAPIAQYGFDLFRLTHSPINRFLMQFLGIPV
jgi:energy-coupling factor transporter transmembrane protein EcfT